jgi:hypothetical protein
MNLIYSRSSGSRNAHAHSRVLSLDVSFRYQAVMSHCDTSLRTAPPTATHRSVLHVTLRHIAPYGISDCDTSVGTACQTATQRSRWHARYNTTLKTACHTATQRSRRHATLRHSAQDGMPRYNTTLKTACHTVTQRSIRHATLR